MTGYSTFEMWLIIVSLGIGTYLVRFSFLGLLGGRDLSPWLLRHLRYTSVAILPGMVTPLVLWPEATGGELDPIRIAAAFVALAVGYMRSSLIWAVIAGMGSLWVMTWIAP